MSTDYVVVGSHKPTLEQLKKKVQAVDLKIESSLEERDKDVNVNDGTNFLWIYFDNEGYLDGATRYGIGNDVSQIIETVEKACKIRFVSEEDDEYWEIMDKIE